MPSQHYNPLFFSHLAGAERPRPVATSKPPNDRFKKLEWLNLERSELYQHAADDSFGRANDEELVVDRSGVRGIAEQIPDANEYLPSRAAERQERQRLVDLEPEPGVGGGAGRISAVRNRGI